MLIASPFSKGGAGGLLLGKDWEMSSDEDTCVPPQDDPLNPVLESRSGLDLVHALVHHLDVEEVNIHEAKTHLSRLLLRVAGGEEIVIARAGKPVAKLVPIEPRPQRVLGQDEGLFEVPEDFDASLPDEVLALFQS